MSAADAGDGESPPESAAATAKVRSQIRCTGRAIFGDRTGLVLWLGLVLALALLWRIGIFLTDTYTVANTLVNLADGHLAITNVEYSLTLGTQPGLHQYDGMLYGRNYGQAVFALPFLWVLQALGTIAEPRFVLLGLWALGFVVFSRQLGGLLAERAVLDRRTEIVVAGSLGAILVVLLGVRWGTRLDPDVLALAALQLSTIVAAASLGLAAYRLLTTFEGTAVGVAAGVAAGLATPIGFWASIPKRHVLVSALVLAAVYCFARSRQTGSLRLRAGAYAFAGLVAWIHAFEGFFLVVVLGAVDLATARSNGWRELAVVAIVLLLALTPTFATNTAIAGNPLQSPRLLPSVGVGGVELAPGGDLQAGGTSTGIRTGGGGGDFVGGGTDGPSAGNGGGSGDASAGGGGSTGTDGSGGAISWLVGLFAALASALIGLLPRPPDTVLVVLSFVVSTVTDGLAAITEAERLWYVFVRSGHIPGVRYLVNQYEVVELTVVESMPLVGALVALPAIAITKLRRRGRTLVGWPRSASPARQTDLLVVAIATMVTVVYLSRLPLHTMLTVRYLLPVFPLALYGVARLGVVSAAVTHSPRGLAVAYLGTVAGGTLLLPGILTVVDPALGEAVQFHALVNLATATALSIAVVGRTIAPARVGRRWVTTTLGVAAGATTIYVCFAAFAYFTYGSFALDGVEVLAKSLSTLV